MTGPTWGSDPLLRWLRAIAVLAFLGMLAVVVFDTDRAQNGELLVLLFGSILIALGYPVVMSLPSIFGSRNGKSPPSKPSKPSKGAGA